MPDALCQLVQSPPLIYHSNSPYRSIFTTRSPLASKVLLYSTCHQWPSSFCQPDDEWSSSQIWTYSLLFCSIPGANCHRLGSWKADAEAEIDMQIFLRSQPLWKAGGVAGLGRESCPTVVQAWQILSQLYKEIQSVYNLLELSHHGQSSWAFRSPWDHILNMGSLGRARPWVMWLSAAEANPEGPDTWRLSADNTPGCLGRKYYLEARSGWHIFMSTTTFHNELNLCVSQGSPEKTEHICIYLCLDR